MTEADDKGRQGSMLAVGIGCGVAIGAGIGVATDNLAMGMGVGIAIGVALGVAMGSGRKNDDGSHGADSGGDEPSPPERRS